MLIFSLISATIKKLIDENKTIDEKIDAAEKMINSIVKENE